VGDARAFKPQCLSSTIGTPVFVGSANEFSSFCLFLQEVCEDNG
jgi:hypothetical protein